MSCMTGCLHAHDWIIMTSCIRDITISYRRSLKTAYELMMLQEGDFDERLFINSQSELDKLPGQQEVGEFEKWDVMILHVIVKVWTCTCNM